MVRSSTSAPARSQPSGAGPSPKEAQTARRLALILAALASLVLPTGAGAHGKPTNPIALAYHAAVSYWHGTPCQGRVTITKAAESKAMRAETWTYYHSHEEAFSWAEHAPGPIDPSRWTGCVVTFNDAYWTDRTAIDNSYETFCVAMIHEFGNLRGLPEVDEGTETKNIMAWNLYSIVPPRQCTHYTLVYPNGHVERKAWTAR